MSENNLENVKLLKLIYLTLLGNLLTIKFSATSRDFNKSFERVNLHVFSNAYLFLNIRHGPHS